MIKSFLSYGRTSLTEFTLTKNSTLFYTVFWQNSFIALNAMPTLMFIEGEMVKTFRHTKKEHRKELVIFAL